MALEAQNNPFTSVLFVGAADPEALPDADPSAGSYRLVIDDTGAAWIVDSTGTATAVGGSSGLTDPMTTRGDIIVRNASNVTARLATGAAGTVLSGGTDPAWVYPVLTVADVIRTTDVNLGSSAYADVVSLSLGAGTWDVYAIANIVNGGGSANTCYAAITDNSNNQIAQVQVGFSASSALAYAAPVMAPGVAGSQTIKLRVFATATSTATGSTNVGTGGGSRIHAVRVA